MVLHWRADLKQKQSEYVGEGDCPLCKKPIQSRPLFMVGEYDYCYSCFRNLELQGIRPPKRAAQVMTHIWFWKSRLPDRKGQPCKVLARGKMNNILVEFVDGYKVVTSRFAVRLIK